jgi:hypothetical protein
VDALVDVVVIRQQYPHWDIGLDEDRHWTALTSPTPTCVIIIAEPTLAQLARSLDSFPRRRPGWQS